MKTHYDIIVVGAGPAGIFTCYEMINKNPDAKVLLIEKGKNIYDRECPVMKEQIKMCPIIDGKRGCSPSCSITNGFGGAGAYSDGKFNITTNYGGWLNDYMNNDKVLELIEYVDKINLRYGATGEMVTQDSEFVRHIEQLASSVDLLLLKSNIRHLGTEENLKILKSIYEILNSKIDILFNTNVTNILSKDGKICGVQTYKHVINSNYVVLTPGRDGSEWLTDILKIHDIETTVNQVDVGVRVETSDVVMYDINKYLYEGKFLFNASVGTQVRTFCSNPSGHVVIENHSGIIAANGHAFRDPSLGSKNTNFALLVSHKFTQPFNKPNEYAREICKRANDLSNGSIIIQKFGDLIKGRRSTDKRINEGFIKPTLKEAVPGDLGLVLPYNTMKSLIEMIYALDRVTPGIASDHTLFYGVEAKFYSARPKLNDNLETKISGLYCGGDGAGITRGLAQASASGILIARDIISKESKKDE